MGLEDGLVEGLSIGLIRIAAGTQVFGEGPGL